MAGRAHRGAGFGFAGLLVIAGAILILSNMDVLPSGYFGALARLWPALLIALGANVLFSRIDARLGSALSLLVIAGALAGAWAMAGSEASATPAEVQNFRIERGDAAAAVIELVAGGAKLTVGPGADAQAIVQGSLGGCREGSVESKVRDEGSVRRVTLSTEDGGFGWTRCWGGGGFSGENWELTLNPEVPTDLRIKAGASDTRLDLRDLRIGNLDIDTGASSTHVVMPASAGITRASFDIGASSIEIEIPAGVAARIKVEVGAGSVDVDESRFPRLGGSVRTSGLAFSGQFKSPDFDGATNRVDITIDGGASSVSIR